MYSWKWELSRRILLTGGIGLCSFLGDQGLKYGRTAVMRAVFDNVTHATVGGLTWSLIVLLSRKSLAQNLSSIVLCFAVSSLIDVDHFLAARSWKINDATHLQKRPFLHCTTLPVLTCVTLIVSSVILNYPKLGHYAWIVIASFLSHHIRDGTRRGLWFCPWGSTAPIPYYAYLCLSMTLPYALYWLTTLCRYPDKTYESIAMTEV